MTNPYEVIPATVMEVQQESPLIRTLRLKPEKPIPFRTGQFIELTIPGIGEGPFTPSSSHYEDEFLDVTVMKTYCSSTPSTRSASSPATTATC